MDIRLHTKNDAAVRNGNAQEGDIDITSNDLVLTSGTESIAQHLTIRLRTFLGEWFLDDRIGIPYFQQFLVKNPSESAMRAILVQAITTTQGIDRLQSLDFTLDSEKRTLSVSFVASPTDSLEPLVFDMELIINV